MKERVMEEVRRMFKPEFLNRIDEILVFHPLTKENINDDRGHSAARHQKRTEDQLGWTLTITDDADDFLADKGYVPNMVQDRCAGRSRRRSRISFLRRSWKARSGKKQRFGLKKMAIS